MDMRKGKAIEKFLVGSVDRVIQLTSREFQRIAYEKGVLDIRGDVKKRVLSGHIIEDDFEAVVKKGLREIKEEVKENLQSEMGIVRKHQKEKDPSTCRGHKFAELLLDDIDMRLSHITDVVDGNNETKYELRLYATDDTKLDYSGGFDFWVEVYNLEENKPEGNVRIDIKIRDGEAPRDPADMIYYFDADKYFDDDEPKGKKLNMAYKNDPHYKNMVLRICEILNKRVKIDSSLKN